MFCIRSGKQGQRRLKQAGEPSPRQRSLSCALTVRVWTLYLPRKEKPRSERTVVCLSSKMTWGKNEELAGHVKGKAWNPGKEVGSRDLSLNSEVNWRDTGLSRALSVNPNSCDQGSSYPLELSFPSCKVGIKAHFVMWPWRQGLLHRCFTTFKLLFVKVGH